MRFGIVLTSCWDHVGIFLGPVGMILGPLDTMVRHLDNNLLYVRPMLKFNEICVPFWTLWGSLLHHWGSLF